MAVEGGSLSPADSRHNVRGLTVELVRRDPSSGQWADHKGLLDFNVLSGDWPDALPEEKGGFPRWVGERGRVGSVPAPNPSLPPAHRPTPTPTPPHPNQAGRAPLQR